MIRKVHPYEEPLVNVIPLANHLFDTEEYVRAMKANISFILQALLAALFFGASAPISKLLLGDVPPVLMAAFLYLGSGTGISLIKLTQRLDVESKGGRDQSLRM